MLPVLYFLCIFVNIFAITYEGSESKFPSQILVVFARLGGYQLLTRAKIDNKDGAFFQ